MSFVIVEAEPESKEGVVLRGAARELWGCRDHEVMISGPAETGKTMGALHKLDALMWKYPRCQAVIGRKVLSTIYGTVLQSFKKVLGPETPVTFYGGEKPQWADYPTGSRIWFAGLDNPGKALSSERDFILINQAEELTLSDWETLATRTTGRAGNAPYSQLIGDCNPRAPTHWIRHRSSLKLLESRHEDNPTLFDDAGTITGRGRRTLEILDNLTGARKQRLRFGRWVQAEGVVYEEWDAAVHLIDPFPIPKSWRRIRSNDFGYVNPFVCQWWAADGDGRIFLYREIYKTGTLVSAHADRIAKVSEGERIEATVSDHDAEDRATLEAPRVDQHGHQLRPGIPTIAAKKDISPGIQTVQERLQRAGDGRARLYIFRNALCHPPDPALVERRLPTCTAEEFDVYVWPEGKDGKAVKDVPLDLNNHGMDAARYAAMYLGGSAPMKAVVAGPPVVRRETLAYLGGR